MKKTSVLLMAFNLLILSQSSFADLSNIGQLQKIITCKDSDGAIVVEISKAKFSLPPYIEASVSSVTQSFRGLNRTRDGNNDVFANNPAFADRAGGASFSLSIDQTEISTTNDLPSKLSYQGADESINVTCRYNNVTF